jgi:hypothetical protein
MLWFSSINYMEQNPSWEANIHSASQEILRRLWEPKVHYCVHMSPLLLHILSQRNPIHTFPPRFSKIHSNIILPFTLRPSKLFLPFRFPNQNSVCISQLSHAFYTTRPSIPPWFSHPTNTSYGTSSDTGNVILNWLADRLSRRFSWFTGFP